MNLFVHFSMGPSLGEISFYWLELIPGEIKLNFYNSHHWCSISKTLYAKSTYFWYSSLTSYSLSPLIRKGGFLSEQKSFHCHFPSKQWRSVFFHSKTILFIFKISADLISCQRNLRTKCYIPPFLLFNKAPLHHSHIESLKVTYLFFLMPTSLRNFFPPSQFYIHRELKTLFCCIRIITFTEHTAEDGSNFTLWRFSQANHIWLKRKYICHLLLGQLIWEWLSRN